MKVASSEARRNVNEELVDWLVDWVVAFVERDEEIIELVLDSVSVWVDSRLYFSRERKNKCKPWVVKIISVGTEEVEICSKVVVTMFSSAVEVIRSLSWWKELIVVLVVDVVVVVVVVVVEVVVVVDVVVSSCPCEKEANRKTGKIFIFLRIFSEIKSFQITIFVRTFQTIWKSKTIAAGCSQNWMIVPFPTVNLSFDNYTFFAKKPWTDNVPACGRFPALQNYSSINTRSKNAMHTI